VVNAAPLAANPLVCGAYAVAHATLEASQARVAALAEHAWGAAQSGRPLDAGERAAITSGCALAVGRARETVAELVALSGMDAIEQAGALARAWRDLQALAAHVSVSSRHLLGAGTVLLQQSPGSSA
jgi:hypothetical protein